MPIRAPSQGPKLTRSTKRRFLLNPLKIFEKCPIYQDQHSRPSVYVGHVMQRLRQHDHLEAGDLRGKPGINGRSSTACHNVLQGDDRHRPRVGLGASGGGGVRSEPRPMPRFDGENGLSALSQKGFKKEQPCFRKTCSSTSTSTSTPTSKTLYLFLPWPYHPRYWR